MTKTELSRRYGDEQVYVVPFQRTSHIGDRFSPSNFINFACWDQLGRFVFRSDAEYNAALQQLITYVLIRNGKDRYYVARRIAGDARLIESLSLGFGGHINPKDGSTNLIYRALKRELSEELTINQQRIQPQFLGYVRDLCSDTKDHLGFVFVVEAAEVQIKEKQVLEGTWMTSDTLFKNYYKFENWARHIIDYLFLHRDKPRL